MTALTELVSVGGKQGESQRRSPGLPCRFEDSVHCQSVLQRWSEPVVAGFPGFALRLGGVGCARGRFVKAQSGLSRCFSASPDVSCFARPPPAKFVDEIPQTEVVLVCSRLRA